MRQATIFVLSVSVFAAVVIIFSISLIIRQSNYAPETYVIEISMSSFGNQTVTETFYYVTSGDVTFYSPNLNDVVEWAIQQANPTHIVIEVHQK